MSFNYSSGTLDSLAGIHSPGKKHRWGSGGGSGAGAKSYDPRGLWVAMMAVDAQRQREIAYGDGTHERQSERATATLDRTAKRAPEVMAKITGRQNGGSAHILANFTYVARLGHGKEKEIELLTSEDKTLTDAKEMRKLAQEWQEWHAGDEVRRKGSTSISMILSMPPGTNPELVHQAGIAFARTEFSNNRWVLALHTDTDSPHVHLTVARRGHDGVRLKPERDDLFRYRQVFAEKLRELGVEANATPCRARGVEPHNEHIRLRKMREKGVELKVDERRAAQVQDIIRGAKEDVSLINARADIAFIKAVYQRAIDEHIASPGPESPAFVATLSKFINGMPEPATKLSRLVEIERHRVNQNVQKEHDRARSEQSDRGIPDRGLGRDHRAGPGAGIGAEARDHLRKSYASALAERPMAQTYSGLRELPGGGLAHRTGRYSELLQSAARDSLLAQGAVGIDGLRWAGNGIGGAGSGLTSSATEHSIEHSTDATVARSLTMDNANAPQSELPEAQVLNAQGSEPGGQSGDTSAGQAEAAPAGAAASEVENSISVDAPASDEKVSPPAESNKAERVVEDGPRRSILPPEIALRYRIEILHEDDPKNRYVALYSAGLGGRLLVEISATTLKTHSENPALIKDLVAIAQHNEWGTISVEGTEEFRRKVWIEASRQGLEVKGYEPTFEERKALEDYLAQQAPEAAPQPKQPQQPEQQQETPSAPQSAGPDAGAKAATDTPVADVEAPAVAEPALAQGEVVAGDVEPQIEAVAPEQGASAIEAPDQADLAPVAAEVAPEVSAPTVEAAIDTPAADVEAPAVAEPALAQSEAAPEVVEPPIEAVAPDTSAMDKWLAEQATPSAPDTSAMDKWLAEQATPSAPDTSAMDKWLAEQNNPKPQNPTRENPARDRDDGFDLDR